MSRARRHIDEANAGIQELLSAKIAGSLAGVHTALPGVVQAYDPATQKADVLPQINRVYRTEEGDLVDLEMPVLLGAPVYFTRAGGVSITVPLEVGDPCLILFAERDISGWIELARKGRPPTGRRHDYSDAIVLPGLAPNSGALTPAASTSGIELRTDDGATLISVGSGGIRIELAAGPFEVETGGAITLTRGANELLALISTALNDIATSTVGGTPLSNAAQITAVRVLVDAMRS